MNQRKFTQQEGKVRKSRSRRSTCCKEKQDEDKVENEKEEEEEEEDGEEEDGEEEEEGEQEEEEEEDNVIIAHRHCHEVRRRAELDTRTAAGPCRERRPDPLRDSTPAALRAAIIRVQT